MKRFFKRLALGVLLALPWVGAASAQQVNVYCQSGSGTGPSSWLPASVANPCPVSASVSASITGFPTTQTTGTPISVTTGGVTGTLPTGTVVVASNVGATNGAYCKLGASATTSDQLIPPNSWFSFTVGAATQLTCITSTSTTTVNMVGGSGLPTGAGGGGGSGGGGGGGAVTLASGAVSSGAYSSGSIASGAYASGSIGSGAVASGAIASGAVASGAFASGSLASGAMVDLVATQTPVAPNTATATKGLLAGGTYTSTQPTLTTTQQAALAFTSRNAVLVAPGVDNFAVQAAINQTTPGTTNGVALVGVNAATALAGAGAVGTGSARVAVGQDTTTIAGAAPGTAGSASANVVTVQGVASMTPVASNITQVLGTALSATNGLYSNILQGNAALSATNGIYGNLLQGNAVLSSTNPIFSGITDGTNGPAAVKAASTPSPATDKSLSVTLNAGSNGIVALGQATKANSVPVTFASDQDPCSYAQKSSVAINTSSATTTSLVAVSGSTAVYVCGFSLTVNNVVTTASTFKFEYGTGASCTGTTALTGVYNTGSVTAGIPSVISYGGAGATIFTAPASNGVCIVTAGTGDDDGVLTYVQQ